MLYSGLMANPMKRVSAYAAPFVDENDDLGEDAPTYQATPRLGRPRDARDAFQVKIAQLHAEAKSRATAYGRKARTWCIYCAIAFGISLLPLPHWIGFWMFWIAVFHGVRGFGAVYEWNVARIESTLSPY